MLRSTWLAVVAPLVLACGSAGGAAAPPTVPWADYAPAVRSRIDAAAAASDCVALQDEFDTAEANDGITRERTGHGNAELMAYIDYQMRVSGCYG